MKFLGLPSYMNASNIVPGELYVASRENGVYLVLAVQAAIKDDPPAVLIIERIDGNAFTADFLIIEGHLFAHSSRYMHLAGALLVPSAVTNLWKMSFGTPPEIGALYCYPEGMSLVARDRDEQRYIVDVVDGSVRGGITSRSFWTSSWSIMLKDANGQWSAVFQR